jgi:hypothetical protein
VRLHFFGQILVALRQFAQQRDLGEAGPKLVMQIARDSGPFFLEGFLLFEVLELPLGFQKPSSLQAVTWN